MGAKTRDENQPKIFTEADLKFEKRDSRYNGFFAGLIAGGLVVSAVIELAGVADPTTSDKLSVVPVCEGQRGYVADATRPIEVSNLPEHLLDGGICKIGDTVVPIVAKVK